MNVPQPTVVSKPAESEIKDSVEPSPEKEEVKVAPQPKKQVEKPEPVSSHDDEVVSLSKSLYNQVELIDSFYP